jgi:hypothetical protein
MRSAPACAQIIEVHAMFDFFLKGEGGFPVDLWFLAEDDCADEGIGAVWRLDTAGSKVGLWFELLAALAIVLLSATGELGDEMISRWSAIRIPCAVRAVVYAQLRRAPSTRAVPDQRSVRTGNGDSLLSA